MEGYVVRPTNEVSTVQLCPKSPCLSFTSAQTDRLLSTSSVHKHTTKYDNASTATILKLLDTRKAIQQIWLGHQILKRDELERDQHFCDLSVSIIFFWTKCVDGGPDIEQRDYNTSFQMKLFVYWNTIFSCWDHFQTYCCASC